MIIKYIEYIKESIKDDFVEYAEQDLNIHLVDLNEYTIFSIYPFRIEDDDELYDLYQISYDEYDKVDKYIDSYLKNECSINVDENGRIDRKTYYVIYLMLRYQLMKNNDYVLEVNTKNTLHIMRYCSIRNILDDIKKLEISKNINNIDDFCKKFIENKLMFKHEFFKKLVNDYGSDELKELYKVYTDANNFDLI